jgi:hypothetical protein
MARGSRSRAISGEPKPGVINYAVVALIAVVWVVGSKPTRYACGSWAKADTVGWLAI